MHIRCVRESQKSYTERLKHIGAHTLAMFNIDPLSYQFECKLAHTTAFVKGLYQDVSAVNKLMVINGPNLTMLGQREPEHYGAQSYDQLGSLIVQESERYCCASIIFQTNYEGEIVELIQASKGVCDGIIINPAAYTHSSIAIRDALLAVEIPYVEVHISKLDTREDFRHISFIRDHALCCIEGKGFNSYIEALKFMHEYLR